MEKATLTAKEVAWSDDKPLMYQNFLEVKVTEDRSIRIIGLPRPTKEAAREALEDEFHQWELAMQAFKRRLATPKKRK